MVKARTMICLTIVLGMLLFANTRAEAIHFQVGLNKVFFLQDQGYLGKLRLDTEEGSKVYFEWLQVSDYFHQRSLGLELFWRKGFFGETSLLVGYENYTLQDYSNDFFRFGARTDFPMRWGEISLEADLMVDHLVGPFVRYQCEVRFPKTWMQSQIGFGNLLGSRDGYALWVGFDL